MERLTRRDWNKYGFYDKETPILGARHEYELYQRLGRYEDAEEQGLLLWIGKGTEYIKLLKENI